MIRLMGLIDFNKSSVSEASLTDKQKQLDVDKDGKIEASDLKKLRTEEEDHEVGMAHNLLDDIIKNAVELKAKMGQDEKDVPAWIQDHISQAQNFIGQANTNYHEYDTPETSAVEEEAPEGWEGTVKAMKDEPGIDNPFALAHWMKKKGYKSHKSEK
jgi:hypothetical protein